MKNREKRPVLPFYAAALTWAIYMFVRRIYRAQDFLLVALTCAVVFVLARALCGTIPEEEAKRREENPLARLPVAAAILAAIVVVTGAARWFTRPAALPEVKAGEWICDAEGVLSEQTRTELARFNENWNEYHDAVCAVVSVPSAKGWDLNELATTVGARWGLGPNDLLLLFVTDGDYRIAYGDNLDAEMTEQQRERIDSAVAEGYENGADAATRALISACTSVYPALKFDLSEFYLLYSFNFYTDSGWKDYAAVRSWWLIGSALTAFLFWAAFDLARYRRWQSRAAETGEDYYPVFWGRN